MKILLADDSVTAQNMGKKILSEAGHEVTCVSNGAAALKKAGEQEPDLLILDIYMPGYSGLEVCQRLKENPATAGLPIVLTVGKLEPFRKEDAQRARAEALIVKPFEASELAAAVARFGDIAAAQAPKAKSRGKLGPQPKPKPQWEEAPEEDFATTTRKLEEQEEAPSKAAETSPSAAPEKAEERTKATPAPPASEFEVAPEASGSEFSPATQAGAGPEEPFSERTTTLATASGSAEFSVEAEVAPSPGDQPEMPPVSASRAAAASAGANFATGVTEAPEFAVAAPSEAAVPESATFVSPITAHAPSLPEAPEMSAAAPEISAAAPRPSEMPGVDPAFDPDRTQWVTAFPTRFGIAEEQENEEETVEPAASQEPQPEATSTAPDEIAAILSNLPGGMAASEEPQQRTEEEQRPWPMETSGSSADGWKAEEVPLEDRDSSISLAEEMDKALGAGMETCAPSSFAEAEAPAIPEDIEPPVTLEKSEEAVQPGPAARVEVVPPSAGEEKYHPENAQPAAGVSVFGQAVSGAPVATDRVAGVMQSAAMAIATRATVSAVASQLHAQPAMESASTGPSAIEELVGQVLERLKPKLIAEIKRELEPEEK
ncbi:MAG: response regulator [Chlamydiota bacterium]